MYNFTLPVEAKALLEARNSGYNNTGKLRFMQQ
jgi:hypothetical protein